MRQLIQPISTKTGAMLIASLLLFTLLFQCAVFPDMSLAAHKKKIKTLRFQNVTNNFVLSKGQKKRLTLSVTPKSASKQKIKWTSSKPSVVSVSRKGLIKAKKKGTAYITAKATDGSGMHKTCKIIVGAKIKKISLYEKNGKHYVGKGGSTLSLHSKLFPITPAYKSLTWKSSNKKIATVSSSGTVKGLKTGTVTITATAKDGSKKKGSFRLSVVLAPKGTTQFFAHRGYSSVAPENTMPAFIQALNAKFDGVECDLWEMPGEAGMPPGFAVMHDENLLRMCGVNKLITTLAASQLHNYPITGGNGIRLYRGTFIPSCEEYLDLMVGSGKIPMVELKGKTPSDEGILELLTMISDRGLGNKIIIQSFNYNTLKKLLKIKAQSFPDMKLNTLFLVSKTAQIESGRLADYQADGIQTIGMAKQLSTSAAVKQVKVYGLKVAVWTVDDTTQAYRLAAKEKVNYLISNKKVFQ